MYRIPRSGGKTELVQRLLTSGYPVSDILARARQLQLGDLIVPYVHKEALKEPLNEAGLPTSGSKTELVLRLIENRLLDAGAILQDLSPASITDLYHWMFGRVPTVSKDRAIEEILSSFDLLEKNASTRFPEEARSSAQFEHDIALSFAGEDRRLAREIGERLRHAGVRVFYDEFYQPELWGKSLSDEFRKRYGPRSRFVVPLISRHYAIKDWTDFEFTIAREEALRRTHEFILPVRLDDTVLVGLRSDVAYLDFGREGIDGVVSTILKKLGVGD